jgi:DNA-binding FadR family transcriptional regulator
VTERAAAGETTRASTRHHRDAAGDDASARVGPRPSGATLASTVADRIVDDIARRGWPEGQVVGSEPDLLERYGVSRAVFREAVRLVEHKQVARMRRGPGGGLVVTLPSLDSVADAVSVYLVYAGAEVDEVFEARLALEGTAAELAPARLDEAGIEALRRLVDQEHDGAVADHRELHRLVATLTGNPALELFVDLLNRVSLLYLPRATSLPAAVLAESAKAHAAIAQAIVAGDDSRARRRMRTHLEAEADYLRARRPSRSLLADLSDTAGRSDKRAEVTARQIFTAVAGAGWPVGTLLGSEAELMARYDVSRAVMREAVRLLEHHQVARMRRGPGGGLFVAEPDFVAVTDAVALQIDRRGMQAEHLFEVRGAVEMAVLDRAMDGLDGGGVAALAAALERERTASPEQFPVVGHDVHNVLAHVAGNRVLELLTGVLIRLTRRHTSVPAGVATAPPVADVIRVHDRIVDAVVAGDRELARHRLRRHLDALADWVS